MPQKKSCRVEKIKLVVNKNKQNTYKILKMLHSLFSMHLCFPLGTVKPCFLSEKVTRADPRTVRFSFSNKILHFWTIIVTQKFYILSDKSGQLSTLIESRSKHFCIHYLYVVKDNKELILIQLSTTQCNSIKMACVPCCLFLRFKSLWWKKTKILLVNHQYKIPVL